MSGGMTNKGTRCGILGGAWFLALLACAALALAPLGLARTHRSGAVAAGSEFAFVVADVIHDDLPVGLAQHDATDHEHQLVAIGQVTGGLHARLPPLLRPNEPWIGPGWSRDGPRRPPRETVA